MTDPQPPSQHPFRECVLAIVFIWFVIYPLIVLFFAL
jgi:hypothetical protein